MKIIMERAKSVTKVIAIVLLICFQEALQSQNMTHDGIFCRVYFPSGDFGNCLDFKTDNTFEYRLSSDMGLVSYAQGEYKLSKGQLILNYNKTAPLKMSYHISEIWESNKDSITVDFDLFDFDGNPATGVEILYKDSLSKRGYRADVSNKDGRSSFKLKRDPSELQFEISSMDYGLTNSIRHTIYYLTIYREWNYKISVYLQKSYTGIPVLNRTDTLKLKKVREKHFEVINDNGSVTTWRKLED